MLIRCIALVATLALGACTTAPAPQAQAEPWNGGIWNSVLGYHGPANATVAGGPAR